MTRSSKQLLAVRSLYMDPKPNIIVTFTVNMYFNLGKL